MPKIVLAQWAMAASLAVRTIHVPVSSPVDSGQAYRVSTAARGIPEPAWMDLPADRLIQAWSDLRSRRPTSDGEGDGIFGILQMVITTLRRKVGAITNTGIFTIITLAHLLAGMVAVRAVAAGSTEVEAQTVTFTVVAEVAGSMAAEASMEVAEGFTAEVVAFMAAAVAAGTAGKGKSRIANLSAHLAQNKVRPRQRFAFNHFEYH